jgi:hypothetical protein
MTNPRLIELAGRLKNERMPEIKPEEKEPEPDKGTESRNSAVFPDSVSASSLLCYDAYGNELIAKANELFAGTKAEIPANGTGEVQNMYLLKRLALITAIAKNPNLRNKDKWPITPLQSEMLLKEGKLPDPSRYWEDLGLILYDTSSSGYNPVEAKALYESIKKHQRELGLSKSDLSSRLVIVNAGLEKNTSAPHGAVPIILPWITQAYHLDVLEKVGQNYKFEYGLDRGLPKVSELGKGSRTLYMPEETKDIGLRVLFRVRDLYVDAGNRYLVNSNSDGRVNLAPQGTKKN